MNSQLEQGKSPWMLEGEGLRSTCPAPGATQLTRGSLQPASASSCPSKVILAWLTPAPTAALGSEVASPLDSSQPDSTHTSLPRWSQHSLPLGLVAHTHNSSSRPHCDFPWTPQPEPLQLACQGTSEHLSSGRLPLLHRPLQKVLFCQIHRNSQTRQRNMSQMKRTGQNPRKRIK